MDAIIKIENLGKKYFIQQNRVRYDTLRDLITEKTKDTLKRLLRKSKHPQKKQEEFWALKDINLEVMKGQRLGIIGRNGAGKSTLLKILSRITNPTVGRAILYGRVSSLLEVGTGFHPELTGRENVFLNGAILGMSKAEIKNKFDDIVDFAEIRQFIDTPVKRYSSGMYVRLAFAVAAHLQPEILIVDEVLAVGDIQFQKKCLGKMAEVSHEQDRTVLFVSHNMGAIQQLCNTAVLLEGGKIISEGETKKVVNDYLSSNMTFGGGKIDQKIFYGELKSVVEFHEVYINNEKNNLIGISPRSEIKIRAKGYVNTDLKKFIFVFSVFKMDVQIFSVYDSSEPKLLPRGEFEVEMVIPANILRPGNYSLGIGGYQIILGRSYIYGQNVMQFEIIEEWSETNPDFAYGIINIPHFKNQNIRKNIEGSDLQKDN